MMKRKLQELNLLDDFLFGKLVTYPGMGEQFCRQLISVILGVELKRVVVILMTPYDPFGYDHMVYTIRNRCEELPDMPYDDGAKTLFLYTKGKKGNPSRQLRELLHYMEDSTEENACNDTLKDIHEMVMKVKHNKEVSIEYMKIFEREKMIYEDGREDGYHTGSEDGFKCGIERGIRILIADNMESGTPVDKIRLKLQKNFEVSETKAQEYLDAYFATVTH